MHIAIEGIESRFLASCGSSADHENHSLPRVNHGPQLELHFRLRPCTVYDDISLPQITACTKTTLLRLKDKWSLYGRVLQFAGD
jgi:hypothetical protein